MAKEQTWIVQKAADDVATAVKSLKAGEKIVDSALNIEIELVQNIPFGHKFALRDLKQGTPIHKYGQIIGGATQDIAAGEHVHVHNLESLRGRGDLHKTREQSAAKEAN